MSLGKIGTVCQVGSFNRKTQTFTQAKGTTIGTITQKSLLQICGVSSIDDLTQDIINIHRDKLTDKLIGKLKQNINALYNQLIFVAGMPTQCHMLRISSNLLPMFDHPQFKTLYSESVLKLVDVLLARCKRVIDEHDIIVCCHPDQFNVVNSESENVRLKSYVCLYMHKYFMERVTDSSKSCINVHLNGNLDHLPEIDRGLYSDLIPWISLENEDKNGKLFTADVLNTLQVCEKYGIKMLLDLHHHYALTGDQISINDSIIDRIDATWNGQTPIMHLSQGKDSSTDRKHSDFIEDNILIEYATDFLHIAHIEIEAKAKSSAVLDFYNNVLKCELNHK
jgi:UV DNA damage repair endonuclease